MSYTLEAIWARALAAYSRGDIDIETLSAVRALLHQIEELNRRLRRRRLVDRITLGPLRRWIARRLS